MNLRWVLSIVSVAAPGAAIAWLAFTAVWAGVIGYSATPTHDQWSWLFPDELIGNLFSQHNEHRIVVARIIFLLDAWFGAQNAVINTIATYLFHIAHAVTLFLVLVRAFQINTAAARALFAAAIAAFFGSTFQFENFVSGFQCQFTGVFLFASVAFACLSMHERMGRGALFAAAAAAALAAGSMANGLVAPALLPFMALVLRMKPRVVIGFAAFAAVLWALYLWQYQSIKVGSGVHDLAFFGRAVSFFLAYIGGVTPQSFAEIQQPRADALLGAEIWGGVGVLGAGALVLDTARKAPGAPLRVAACFILLFALATAAMTAIGRAGMSDQVSISNRYGTATAAFWVVLAGWLLGAAARASTRIYAGAAAICAAVIAVMCLAQPVYLYGAKEFGLRKREAGLALISGARLPDILGQAHPDANTVWDRGEKLREMHYATFAEPWSRLIDEKIEGADTKLPACKRSSLSLVEELAAVDRPEWRLSAQGGFVSGARAVAFVRADGLARGFGIRAMRDDPRATAMFKAPGPRRWSGFATGAPGEALTAVAISRAGKAICRFDGQVVLTQAPPMEAIDASRLGPVLAAEIISGDATWVLNGMHPAAPPAPGGGASFGSWTGGDGHRGQVKLRIAPPKVGAIALPILSGPSSTGLAIVVRQNGEVLAKWSGSLHFSGWMLWRIEVPSPDDPVIVEAVDAGDGWGQWLGVGPPHQVCDKAC